MCTRSSTGERTAYGCVIPYPSYRRLKLRRSKRALRTKSAAMLSSSTCTTSHIAATPADSAPCQKGCAREQRDTASSIQARTLESCSWTPAVTSTFGLEPMAHIRGRLSTRFRRSRIRPMRIATLRAMTCLFLGCRFHHLVELLRQHRFCCSPEAMLERPSA